MVRKGLPRPFGSHDPVLAHQPLPPAAWRPAPTLAGAAPSRSCGRRRLAGSQSEPPRAREAARGRRARGGTASGPGPSIGPLAGRSCMGRAGFEPATLGLKVPCSTTELTAPRASIGRRFGHPAGGGEVPPAGYVRPIRRLGHSTCGGSLRTWGRSPRLDLREAVRVRAASRFVRPARLARARGGLLEHPRRGSTSRATSSSGSPTIATGWALVFVDARTGDSRG